MAGDYPAVRMDPINFNNMLSKLGSQATDKMKATDKIKLLGKRIGDAVDQPTAMCLDPKQNPFSSIAPSPFALPMSDQENSPLVANRFCINDVNDKVVVEETTSGCIDVPLQPNNGVPSSEDSLHGQPPAVAGQSVSPTAGRPTERLPPSALKQSRSAQKSRGQKSIQDFFPTSDGQSCDCEYPAPGNGHPGPSVASQLSQLQMQLVMAAEEEAKLRQRQQQLEGSLEALRSERDESQARLQRLQHELEESKASREAEKARAQAAMLKLAQRLARSERQVASVQVAGSCARLGALVAARNGGIAVHECWEDGAAFLELAVRQRSLAQQKEDAEGARKVLRKRMPPPPRASSSGRVSTGDAAGEPSSSGRDTSSGAEFVHQDEMIKARLAILKREEENLTREEQLLRQQKLLHIRELKRVRDEGGSRFSEVGLLNGRYVPLALLGRGGFSEVFRAWDLVEMCEVAVKILQISSSWSSAKRAGYVRHAMREYHIHIALQHPNIVGLTDIFEIDDSSFGLVLEFCAGGDLDTLLQQLQTIGEREARAFLVQMANGLVYLMEKRIIHYDLKPANILFDGAGSAKISDFGLSKIVEDGQTMGMDLTSQGAGTYWYLPPECFVVGGQAPKITNKVDVWSLGVIFYQMLYGRRPFGEGCSQEQIFHQGIMLNAREVAFPPKPAVSEAGKEFIRRCLAYRSEDRWDIKTAAADPYLQLRR